MPTTSSLRKKLKITKIQKHSLFSNLKKPAVNIGFLFAVLAAAFSALPNVIPKQLMHGNTASADPLMLVFVIYVANSLLFSPVHRKKNTNQPKIRKKTLVLLVLLGLAEASGTLSYTVGLEETSATNASILVNSETVFAILLGIMIFRERLQRMEVFPFLLIVFGSIFIPMGNDLYENNFELSELMVGDFLIVMSGFFYCLDTFIAKKLDGSVRTKQIVHVMSCTGAVLSLAMMVLFEVPFFATMEQLSIISVVGVLGIGVTMLFFVMALRMIGAVRTVLIYSTTTVFSIAYSAVILSESITVMNAVSALTVLAGLVILRDKIGSD